MDKILNLKSQKTTKKCKKSYLSASRTMSTPHANTASELPAAVGKEICLSTQPHSDKDASMQATNNRRVGGRLREVRCRHGPECPYLKGDKGKRGCDYFHTRYEVAASKGHCPGFYRQNNGPRPPKGPSKGHGYPQPVVDNSVAVPCLAPSPRPSSPEVTFPEEDMEKRVGDLRL